MDVNRLLAALPWVEELPENPYENLTQAAGQKMSFSWKMEGEWERTGVKVGITLFLRRRRKEHTSIPHLLLTYCACGAWPTCTKS